MAFNGTTAEDLMGRGRYIARWITTYLDGNLAVTGYCVYDTKECKTLFEHKDRGVCQKLANILNEGGNHGI